MLAGYFGQCGQSNGSRQSYVSHRVQAHPSEPHVPSRTSPGGVVNSGQLQFGQSFFLFDQLDRGRDCGLHVEKFPCVGFPTFGVGWRGHCVRGRIGVGRWPRFRGLSLQRVHVVKLSLGTYIHFFVYKTTCTCTTLLGPCMIFKSKNQKNENVGIASNTCTCRF